MPSNANTSPAHVCLQHLQRCLSVDNSPPQLPDLILPPFLQSDSTKSIAETSSACRSLTNLLPDIPNLKAIPPLAMPAYRYSSLSQADSVIRLLRLLPSSNNPEVLKCELFECRLHMQATSHPYEALSYVWGSENKPNSISLVTQQNEEQELPVTQSLYLALLRLRDYDIPRILWVDAICINQIDDREKEHQIQLMPAIYAKSIRVIVWLGAAKDDSDQAIESILAAAEESIYISSSNIQTSEQAIQKLLKRPWFNRVWVSE